jgi:hypothetical protein
MGYKIVFVLFVIERYKRLEIAKKKYNKEHLVYLYSIGLEVC